MNENVKTAVYAGVAAFLGLLAWWTLPRAPEINIIELMVGKPLFEKFDDTSKAASLAITWYDDTLGTVKSFKVAKVGGQWVVPSHENYPADAQQQLQDAAKSLFRLECLHVATEIPEEHEKFGVVEPPKDTGSTAKKGIGKLIVLQDDKGEDLVRLVVGKEVDQSPGQRFVRIATSGELTPQVYITKIEIDKLPTEFGKWIERDLLKLDPNDVAQLGLKDYSIIRNQNRYEVQLKMDSTVSWDTLQGSWNLDRFQIYDDGNKPHEAKLAEGEELAKTKLDGLKNALDDLKIESVDRKPEGLGAEMAVDEKLYSDQELVASLQEHGYFAGRPRDGKYEIFSRNGEVNVDCKDGVRYTLRFGDVAGLQEGAGVDKLNRYLLVSAQVAENMLPMPVLEQEPAGPEPSAPPKDATKPAAANGDESQEEEADVEQAKEDEAAKDGASQTKPDETATGKGAKGKSGSKAKAGDEPKTGAKANVPAAPESKPPVDQAQTRREAIKKENERKLKEYDDKRKKAQGRVAALNGRFAKWYYVISEDTYKKIHLGRADIIQEGASAKDSGFGVDAFRKLESEGLKKNSPPSAGGSPGGFPGGFPGGRLPMSP